MRFSLTSSTAARRVVALVLIQLLVLTPSAFAFKQGIHENITESKLQGAGFSQKSANVVGDANWYTDIYEQTTSSAHFDDESLAQGSARLRGKIDSIIQNLANCQKDEALKEMGRALHTLQDFYAHSNWVNHWGGVNGSIYSMANPPSTLSCSPPTFGPGGVTTGYFSLFGFLYPSPFITQCATTPSNKCCHKELNKDDAGRPFHGPARSSAEAATSEFAQRVETEIRSRYPGARGEAMVKLLKKDQRDIAFVIDDTGSMSTDLAGVKSTVNSLVDSITAGDESPRFSLYTFKDSTTFRGATCDPTEMKAKVAPLFASGGGDCPEMANSAQLAAAQALQKGGQIFLATDASPRDPGVAPTLLSVVQAKNINISVILTGNCTSDSSLRAEADSHEDLISATAVPPVIPPSDLTSSSSQRAFGALAALSGGMLFRVSRIEFPQAAEIILNRTRPENADVLYAIDNSGTGGKSYAVPVDSALEDVTFVVSRLQATGTFTLNLKRPDGSVVAAGDPGVSFTTISGVRAVKVDDPADGTWTMDVAGTGKFVASVFGKSELNLTRFSFLQAPVLQRPEVDFTPLPGLPVAGETTTGEARVSGERSSVAFGLRNPDATVIEPLALTEARENVFQGDVAAPPTDFLVYANGVDINGQPFQRVFRQFFKAQTVRVTPKVLFQTVAPGASAPYEFDVTNLSGTAMSYVLYRNSASGYPVSGPSSLSLAAGETKTVTLTVSVPASAATGTEDPLSLVVTSTADPGVTNNAVVFTLVGSTNQPPDVSGAAPSRDRLFPPNGKFEEVDIEGVSDPDGDDVTITIDSIQQDEAVDATGDGSTCPDAGGVGTPTAMLRAERSGEGDGRVYVIAFTATDGRGGTASGSVTVCVPHDMGGGNGDSCVDSQLRYDSTVCPTQ
ncbi:MAG TPA: VWA domain-containing protein [Thermoanaerobaculia bacterium]